MGKAVFGGAGALTLVTAIAEAMRGGHVLIGVDFDGTLAPLVDDPADSVPDPEAMTILAELANHPRTTVAVVSGRALADLRRRLGPLPGAILIGEHGNDTGGSELPTTRDLEAARAFVSRLSDEFGPLTVEHKQQSVTVHTRGLGGRAPESIASLVRAFAADHPRLTLLEGKQVFELTTATNTKGIALGELAAGFDSVIYLGDDQTDETVFEILGESDVGIKVGEGDTSARYSVADVPAVVEVLRRVKLALG